MSEAGFDTSGIFNDDYLWFYGQVLTGERSRREVDEIVTALDLVVTATRGR